MIIVDAFGMRDAGRVKEINEDYFKIVEPEEATEAEERGRLFVVADGMGNHGAGEEAAMLAVNTVVEEYYSGQGGGDPEDCLRYAVEMAHEAIREAAQQNPEYHKMGATLTAMALVDDQVCLAHVGDTRAYLVRRNNLIQLTDDHNWAGEQLRKGAITKVHAHTHPRRKNLTRSLGQTPHVEVDTRCETIEPGDIFLLASDGLYDTLSETEIERVLQDVGPEMACRELVARANRNGGADNIAAIVVKTVYEGKPYLVKERKPAFKFDKINIPAIIDKLPRVPQGFAFYLGMVALALFIIIGGSMLIFRGCSEDEPRVEIVEPGPGGVTPASVTEDDEHATVKIITVPDGAKIKVDGASIGESPKNVELSPGDHEIDIELEGYQPKKHQLTINPGEKQIPLNFILVPHEPARSPDMVFVKAGFFIMGRAAGTAEEGPQKKVWLDAFYIDRYEVSNADYRGFLDATGRRPPAYWDDPDRNAPDLPVVGVDWADSDAYCRWANKRLPTEAEWEKAARGTDGWFYPWGNAFEKDKANVDGDEDGYLDVAPVNALEAGKSPFGVYNMIGNVAEWTASYFDPNYYTYMPMKNPKGADNGNRRVIRGGSYRTGVRYASATYRSAFAPEARKPYIGFRCAKD